MTYIGEEFQKRYKTLPEDIQNALTAVASVETLTAIGKKHGLMVDQIGKMSDEIWKVMLGLANPKDFIRNLAGSLGIESEKASAIASEVNAQMFQPVRESLRRIYDESRIMNQESRELSSSLRPREAGEAIPQSKDEIATSPRNGGAPRNGGVPSMIYPQDPHLPPARQSHSGGVGQGFEEEFKKEPAKEDIASSMYHGVRGKEEKKEAPEQIAPLVPSVVEGPLPAVVPFGQGELHEDDFTYPEKTKEVHREPASPAGGPAADQGGYKGRDPYKESIE